MYKLRATNKCNIKVIITLFHPPKKAKLEYKNVASEKEDKVQN